MILRFIQSKRLTVYRVFVLIALCAAAVFSSCEKRTAYYAQFLPDAFEDFEPGETMSPNGSQPDEPEKKAPAKPKLKAKPKPKRRPKPAPAVAEKPEQPAEDTVPKVEGVRPPTSHAEQGIFARLFSGWGKKLPEQDPDTPASPDVVVHKDGEADDIKSEPIVIVNAFKDGDERSRAKRPAKRSKRKRISPPKRPRAKKPPPATPKARSRVKAAAAAKGQTLRLSAKTRPSSGMAAVHSRRTPRAASGPMTPARRAYHQGLAAEARGQKDKAHEMFLLACSGGYFSACNRYGFVQMNKGNVSGARNYFKVACLNGIARGCNNLGWAYERASQFADARLYYSQACAKRHDQGCANFLRIRQLLKAKPYLAK